MTPTPWRSARAGRTMVGALGAGGRLRPFPNGKPVLRGLLVAVPPCLPPQALGDELSTAPVCVGPFKFVERMPQDRIAIEGFDGYWYNDQIQIERIEVRPIPDRTVRLTNLRSGQLDLPEHLAPNDLAPVNLDASRRLQRRRQTTACVKIYLAASMM